MSEERLKDLLARAVPEAPEIRADGVPERAAAVRRRQVVAGGAALALVAAGVIGGFALRGSDDDESQVADDVPTTPSGSTAPYDVQLCPALLAAVPDVLQAVPDLDDVVAVRLCPDLTPHSGPRGGPAPPRDEVARLDDLDAVVNVEAFRDALRDAPPYDEAMCANLDFFDDRSSLMFVHANGATEMARTAFCSPISTGAGIVDGESLTTVLLTALDQQRDELDYTRPFDGELTCDTRAFQTPARPGRERLVAAIACDPADELVDTLDDGQLAELQAAWDDPQAVTADATPRDENDCLDLDDAPAYVKAVTDRADIVRLFRSPCGYLVWGSWMPGQNAAIPITLEELGLR